MFDYWCVQMVYTEILVFQNRVISKNVYKIVHVCPPHTAPFYSQAGFQEHRVKKHGAPMESWTDGPILEDAFEEPTADVNVEHEDHSNFPAEELDQLGEEFDENRPTEDIETEEEVEENTNVSESARNPIVECLKCGSKFE